MCQWGALPGPKKAFDNAYHGILVDKLCLLGFQDHSGNWFKSYLNDHKRNVLVVYQLKQIVHLGYPRAPFWGPCYSHHM